MTEITYLGPMPSGQAVAASARADAGGTDGPVGGPSRGRRGGFRHRRRLGANQSKAFWAPNTGLSGTLGGANSNQALLARGERRPRFFAAARISAALGQHNAPESERSNMCSARRRHAALCSGRCVASRSFTNLVSSMSLRPGPPSSSSIMHGAASAAALMHQGFTDASC